MRKKLIAGLLTMMLFLLSGCGVSDEGKAFVEDKAVQEEAKNKVIQKADELYGLELASVAEELHFQRIPAMPYIDYEQVHIKMSTKTEPIYTVPASIGVDYTKNERYSLLEVNSIRFDYLNFSNFLLTHLYEQKNEAYLKKIADEHGAKVSRIWVPSIFTNENKNNKNARISQDLIAHYHSGKFNDVNEYESMMDTFAHKIFYDSERNVEDLKLKMPEIGMYMVYENKNSIKKFNDFVAYMKQDPNLPYGKYQIHISSGDTQKTPELPESVTIYVYNEETNE